MLLFDTFEADVPPANARACRQQTHAPAAQPGHARRHRQDRTGGCARCWPGQGGEARQDVLCAVCSHCRPSPCYVNPGFAGATWQGALQLRVRPPLCAACTLGPFCARVYRCARRWRGPGGRQWAPAEAQPQPAEAQPQPEPRPGFMTSRPIYGNAQHAAGSVLRPCSPFMSQGQRSASQCSISQCSTSLCSASLAGRLATRNTKKFASRCETTSRQGR